MSSPTLDDVLASRAASGKEIVDVDRPLSKIVICQLGEGWYAFHGERIREILAQAEVFFVPGCPPSLEGVVNVRGDIEAVIRPHALLGLAEESPGPQAAILLGRGSGIAGSGLRVDRVEDVTDVAPEAIHSPPHDLSHQMAPLVLGVLHWREKSVTLLDFDRLLTEYAQGQG
ncbi:MAG: purine-binding chemotaxis protein CheW [Magnetococcales bacterium]|nr:purine-binding chemotaxis protein CheW [Magnetococcales bacterium]